MRTWSWWIIVACACTETTLPVSLPTTSDEPTLPPVPKPTTPTLPPVELCDPLDGLTVLSGVATQPWSEHEAQIEVTLSAPAAVAVACELDGDPDEVHLAEGFTPSDAHTLRLSGLLADATYHCAAAPTCPTTGGPAFAFDLQTGPEQNPLLPEIVSLTHTATASADYVVTNDQHSGSWNGQRRFVFDKETHVRWHAATGVGGGAGGSAFTYQEATDTFTIGGGWPPNNNGRPQEIEPYGSTVLYDTLDVLPNASALLFHHEARQLTDGRFLTLEQHTIQKSDGGTFDGFGVQIVDPTTHTVDFTYTSQRPYDEGDLAGGFGDAYHANWADVVDDVLFVSLCVNRKIVAIDVPSGNWRWTFGAGGDFDLVDANGNPLSDDAYPQCQHGLQRAGDRLLVYDNGQSRGFSRAVEYQLDETLGVATELWDWTEPDWFETSLGGVDYTSNGGVLVSECHIEESTPSPGDHSTFVEIDPTTGDKRWEVQYAEVDEMCFRAQSVAPCELFANAKHCSQTRARLDALAPVLLTTTAPE